MTRPPVKRTYGRSNKRPLPNDLPSSPTRQHKRVNFNDSLPTSDDQENQQPDLDQPGKHDAVQAYRRGKCTPTNAEDKVFSEKNGRLRENADPVLKHIVSTNITNIPSSSKPPRRGQTTISDFFTSKPTAPTTHTPHRTFKPSPPTPPHRLLSPPPSSPSPSSPFPSVRARPRKLTIPHFTIDAPPAAMTPKPRRYEQLYLELGQRNCGATTCAECHMSYNRGQREDDILHEAYHRVAVGGIDYPGYKDEVVIDEDDAGHVVMLTHQSGAREKKKLQEILATIHTELGSVDLPEEKLKQCKIFIYVSARKKALGCVVAERIVNAYLVVPVGVSERAERARGTAVRIGVDENSEVKEKSADKLREAEEVEEEEAAEAKGEEGMMQIQDGGVDASSAIFCSTKPIPSVCGISRIWVSRHHRGKGIATRLLDAVRTKFIFGCPLDRAAIAFSQPTGDGKRLAVAYTGTQRFLVYAETT